MGYLVSDIYDGGAGIIEGYLRRFCQSEDDLDLLLAEIVEHTYRFSNASDSVELIESIDAVKVIFRDVPFDEADSCAGLIRRRLTVYLDTLFIHRANEETGGDSISWARRMHYVKRYCEYFKGHTAYCCEQRLLDIASVDLNMFLDSVASWNDFSSILEYMSTAIFTVADSITIPIVQDRIDVLINEISAQSVSVGKEAEKKRLVQMLTSGEITVVD